MTETQNRQPAPASDAPRRPERRPTLGSRPAFWPTAILVSASFLLMFEFLSCQLTHGKDPALGSASTAAAKPPRPVLIRRVVNTRVIADGGTGTSGETTVSSGSASSASSAASGAVAAAPAPAPAPAAPVVSGSS